MASFCLVRISKYSLLLTSAFWLLHGISPGFLPGRRSEITLRAHDADVWFHELAHAVDARLTEGGKLKGGQQQEQEIVAEMASGVLCQLYDIEG